MNNDSTLIRNLVSVRFFEDGRVLTYYNDRFVLKPGDVVFVSGKYAGKPGEVEKVITKFRINLADYQHVLSKTHGEIHGTYEAILDTMVSNDPEAMSPAEFASWIRPGERLDEDEEEIILGEGYELDLSDIENSEDVDPAVLGRAEDYCCTGRVAYIRVQDGLGTAFVKGSTWYEVNFSLAGDSLTEMYCDCPYPGLCKHLLAVALKIRALKDAGLDTSCSFTVIDAERFWSMLARTTKKITL